MARIFISIVPLLIVPCYYIRQKMEVINFCPIFLRNVEYGAIIMLSLEEDMRLGKTFDMDIWILH